MDSSLNRDKILNYSSHISTPYEALAVIYDEIMQQVNYRHWARYIFKLIQRHSPYSHIKVLDVGCGTGQFIYELRTLGLPVEGCDPSPAMLKIARRRNPKVHLWIDKLPELSEVPSDQYSVITCLYDTINYLPTLDLVNQTLQRIYSLLPPGGLFIFDVVSEVFCQHYYHHINEQEVINSDYAYARYAHYDAKKHQQINEFSIYTPEGVFEERHVQTIYPYKDLRSLISHNTKFRIIGVYQDFTYLKAKEDSNRAHFVLQKNEAQ